MAGRGAQGTVQAEGPPSRGGPSWTNWGEQLKAPSTGRRVQGVQGETGQQQKALSGRMIGASLKPWGAAASWRGRDTGAEGTAGRSDVHWVASWGESGGQPMLATAGVWRAPPWLGPHSPVVAVGPSRGQIPSSHCSRALTQAL